MTLPTIHDGDLVAYAAPTREALHQAFTRVYELAKDRAAAAGQRIDRETGEVTDRRYYLAFGEAVDDVTLRQHKFYRGPVLQQIADQAPGSWTRDAYHELFRREVLGSEQVRVQVAGRPRPTVYQRLRSTADLSVKQMSDFIDQVIALAVTTWGVEFRFDADEREAVRWKRKTLQPRAAQRETEEAAA